MVWRAPDALLKELVVSNFGLTDSNDRFVIYHAYFLDDLCGLDVVKLLNFN